jgi:lauroyl/myristoyl acyltransferase
VRLTGAEHLRHSLEGGRGAVLWIADQVFAGDAVKVGLGEAGYAVSHMSRPEHGFSDTRFGLRVLNPIRTRFEMRYLKERVVFDRDKPATTMRTLRKRLTGNGVVSFLASAYEGRSLIERPFLQGTTSVATGAPRLALSAGASLHPVFVRRTETPGRLEVVIEGSILPSGEGKGEEAIVKAAGGYLARLEAYVRDDPALWRGWTQSVASDEEPHEVDA